MLVPNVIVCTNTFRNNKRLKNTSKFENQKVLEFSVPQDGFFPEAQAEKADKKLI